ncbi:uncharacterized protein DUF1090 [Vreelandella songnenensis]|uniref:Uncharacterized protein DUF1090 n=1 Tax=Vreelandella songnenensis TaxID=1176243 RepID=A0A2T0UZU0_9GAMM|nr:DUF1090 domain-containing protein [Halomonas songnenensis]PRY63421.1 uncharacterized protein DUF1090 [Halomonas songnenensis]
MRHRLTKMGTMALLAGVLLPLTASANEVLCESKAAEIQEQLEHAQAQNNQHRVEGLERALNAIENDCTNERVLNDATDEVKESLQEVQERQAEFEQALSDGDEDDIRKRRVKLEEATLELEEDTEALNALQGQLGN